jgi:hypothetical protein
MPSSLLPSRFQQHDASSTSWLLPVILFLTSILSNIATSTAHSLLTSAVAWIGVGVYTSLRLRRTRSNKDEGAVNRQARRLAWAAGGLLALGKICERAVDGRGIWWADVCTPISIYTVNAKQYSTRAYCLSHWPSFFRLLSFLRKPPIVRHRAQRNRTIPLLQRLRLRTLVSSS